MCYYSLRGSDMQDMVTVKDIAKKWNLTERRIAVLCKEGKIPGARKYNRIWMIPNDAERPEDNRIKTGNYMRKKKQNGLRLPVGIMDYKEIITNNYYYVDKTSLIKDFIDELPKVVLFTRPRRFGKTMMMNMLKTFFEKSDEDTSIYFKKQKIWACGKKYREYQGKFPVIFLTFKDIKKQTWKETLEGLSNLIIAEFIRHKELSDSAYISSPDYYQRIISKTASQDDYEMSLKMLSLMLKEHYGTAPIIIIDEYDIPIQQGYFCGFYDEVILFMRNFFSGAFKDNENLSYGFLTGILRVAKESIFSGLNNLTIASVLDEQYSKYFGFTLDEVRAMSEYYDCPEKLNEICSWYDGYHFGSTDIFNPWSVINYFYHGCKSQTYWQSTGSNEIIGDILNGADNDVLDNLTDLLKGEKVITYVDTGVIYPQVRKNPSTIYSFLLMTGYLKASDVNVSPTGDYICAVSIPNKEISYVYNKEILQKLDKTIPAGIAASIQAALFSGDVSLFQRQLQKLLIQSVSYYDTVKESFYHGFMLGLCVLMGDYFTTSNQESGEGRFDIQLFPKRKDLPGILIELKAGNGNDSELQRLADAAISQIKEKRYDTQLRTHNIKEIFLYGVAFNGKHVKVVFEKIDD